MNFPNASRVNFKTDPIYDHIFAPRTSVSISRGNLNASIIAEELADGVGEIHMWLLIPTEPGEPTEPEKPNRPTRPDRDDKERDRNKEEKPEENLEVDTNNYQPTIDKLSKTGESRKYYNIIGILLILLGFIGLKINN